MKECGKEVNFFWSRQKIQIDWILWPAQIELQTGKTENIQMLYKFEFSLLKIYKVFDSRSL